jgi:hypothetical protein
MKNLAVAYSVKRRAKKSDKAKDESMKENSIDKAKDMEDEEMLMGKKPKMMQPPKAAMEMPDADDEAEIDMLAPKKKMMAKGGMVDKIMQKRMGKMAEGGEVDLQTNADEDLNMEDDLSFDAARKDTYFDDSQMSDQPEDSNEHGRLLDDADAHDMVEMIRKKIKSRI